MFALFGVMFWAIWSDLITCSAISTASRSGITTALKLALGGEKRHHGQSVVCDYRLNGAWALIRNLPGLLEVLVLSRLICARARRMPLLPSLTTSLLLWCDDGVRIAGRLLG